ncbi:MAG TPA: SDR family oxidoreductase [Stellaceae bacterium]|jgi:NAD(P)-dependent dehydrogenase (short-subunit alcohol dehydrogenase family)|nr:SDR family oxidoreductase [Stellaceae bacterium]
MQGKVCVITGATSGLGLEAAQRLAQLGANLVLVGRDRDRGEAALLRLRGAVPEVSVRMHYADLSLMSEQKRVATEIRDAEPRIDVLINNAGALFASRHETEEGLELSFALNHMAYFVVTNILLDRLRGAAPSRIVSTASGAHRGQRLDFADLQAENHYSGMAVYGRSKLANILFTRELARRLAGSEVTANCLHPGFVATRFGNDNGLIARVGIRIAQLGAIPVAKGAETIVYLASSPEVAGASGGYYQKSRLARPSAEAQSDEAASRLWAESARLSGMAV